MTAEEQALTADEIKRVRELVGFFNPPWTIEELKRGHRYLPGGTKQYKDYASYVDD